MSELKPCPFHKQETAPILRYFFGKESGDGYAEIECPTCGVYMHEHERSTIEETVERLTDRWNTRYERTCTNTFKHPKWDTSFICSECGGNHGAIGHNKYCPDCGAKVVPNE